MMAFTFRPGVAGAFRLAALALITLAAAAPKQVQAQSFPIATNPALVEFAGGAIRAGTNYAVGYVAGTNLVFQLVSTNGQLVGSTVQVGCNTGFPPAAAMAGARTCGLAVWSDTTLTGGQTAFGRICGSDGSVGTAFPLLGQTGTHGFQMVLAAASDGTNFLVVWLDRGQNNYYGQRVGGSGALLGQEFLLFPGPGSNRLDVALAFGRTNYLVAGQGGGNGISHTYCLPVSLDGTGGSITQISTTPSWIQNPLALGFDGTNFVAVWNVSTDGLPDQYALVARRVSASGLPLGDEAWAATDGASFPALAFDGANHLLAWSRGATTGTNANINARFLDASLNPIGPVFRPFSPAGSWPPLLPLRGVMFDGSQYLLTATYGTFVANANGDIMGFNGGDVYGRLLPRSTLPPVFGNSVKTGGVISVALKVVPGVTYTIEMSTNLQAWQPEGMVSSPDTNVISLADSTSLTNSRWMFYRAAMGNTIGAGFDLGFLEYAHGGGFGSGVTPSPSYPVSLNSYIALLQVSDEISPPAPGTVFFTGPSGSGLSHTAADPNNSSVGDDWATYQSPSVTSPAAAPGGAWTVSYRGTNINFTIPDPQAATRLVILLPTANVSGGVLQSISWVYKNPANGATLGAAPSYLSSIQVQVDGISGGRIYNSENLPPTVTSHTLTSAVNWSSVGTVYMTYSDSLGNHYVVSFSKP